MIGLGLNITRSRFGTASTLFTNPIPGLSPTLWLRADALTGLEDEDVVDTWPDSSGNGNDATQGTFVKMPLFHPGEAAFDGIDDFLQTGSLTAGDLTLCVAFTLDSHISFANLVSLVSGEFELRFFIDTGRPQLLYATGVGTVGDDAIPLATKTIVSARRNASTGDVDLLVNGAVVATGSTAITPTASPIRIGSSDGTTSFLHAGIHEVVLIPSVLDDETLSEVHASIAARNGITL